MRFEVWDLGFWDLRIDTVTVYNVSRRFAYSVDGVIGRFSLVPSGYSDNNDRDEWSENTGNTDKDAARHLAGLSCLFQTTRNEAASRRIRRVDD